MGWYTHPDTLCIAYAIAVANRGTKEAGHARESVEWQKAYRNAYAHTAGTEAVEYIQQLDALIKEMGGEPDTLKIPEEWAKEFKVLIRDPDGWRNTGMPWLTPITRELFEKLLAECTFEKLE